MADNKKDLDILIDSIFESASNKEAYERTFMLLNQFKQKSYEDGVQSEREKNQSDFNEYWNENLSDLMCKLEKIAGRILTDNNLVVARDAFGKIAKDIFYAGKKCNQDDVYNIQKCMMEQEKERKELMDRLRLANQEIAELKDKIGWLEQIR
jgi:hypothetical protein